MICERLILFIQGKGEDISMAPLERKGVDVMISAIPVHRSVCVGKFVDSAEDAERCYGLRGGEEDEV